MAKDVRSNVILGIDVNEFRKGIAQVDSSIKGISRQFQNLGGIIGASFAVSKIQDFAQECINLAVEAEGVERAFSRIGTQDTLQTLRNAVRGTISDLELMKQANQAASVGIGMETLATTMQYVQKYARATGQEMDKLMGDATQELIRQTGLRLDQLGINLQVVRERMKETGSYTEAVLSVMRENMDSFGDSSLTAADKLDQQRASMQNLEAQLGQNLMPLYVGFLESVNGLLKGVNVLWNEQFSFIDKIAYWATYLDPVNGELNRMVMEATKAGEASAEIADNGEVAWNNFEGLAKAAKKTGDELKKVAGIKVQGGLRLADVEPGLAPKGTAVTPLYQTDMALFGIRKQAEYAAGSWEHYTKAQADAAGKSAEWTMRGQEEAAQLAAIATIGAEFGQIFQASFNAAIQSGESFFESLKAGMKAYIQQMLAATAATLALATAMAIIFPQIGFSKAFNILGGGMGLPFGFGGEGDSQFGLRISGNDFYTGVDRNNKRQQRMGNG